MRLLPVHRRETHTVPIQVVVESFVDYVDVSDKEAGRGQRIVDGEE